MLNLKLSMYRFINPHILVLGKRSFNITLCLIILFMPIVSPCKGIVTFDIEDNISFEQDENNPFVVIYNINLSTNMTSMRLISINLTVGSDKNDKSINCHYTFDNITQKDEYIKNLKKGSYKLISIPVDFNSPKLNSGDFADWVSDVNGTAYWDKAWYKIEIVPLVGNSKILEKEYAPLFSKNGYITKDLATIAIRTNQCPQIELEFPPNMQNFYINKSSSIKIVNFSYKPFDDVCLKNCTLYVNDIPDLSPEEWPINNKSYTFMRQLNLSAGIYTWYIKCCDDEGKCRNSDIRIIKVNYDDPPIISLIPQNDTSFAINEPLKFRCNAYDDQRIINCSLFIDNDYINSDFLIENNEYIFKHTFTNFRDIGDHEWHVECCDNLSQCNNSSYSLRISLLPQTVLFVVPEAFLQYRHVISEEANPNVYYSKISEAIAELPPSGGTIIVMGYGAEYEEQNIILNKPVNLTGIGYPIIRGNYEFKSLNINYNNAALIIKSNNTIIQGFKLINHEMGIYSVTQGCNFSYSNLSIINNIITGCGYGVSLDSYNNLENIIVSNNSIENSSYGLTLYCPYYLQGVSHINESRNIIIKNLISGCYVGILLESCPKVNISNNEIYLNDVGVYVKNSDKIIINCNNISRSHFGIAECDSNITKINNNYLNIIKENEVSRCL